MNLKLEQVTEDTKPLFADIVTKHHSYVNHTRIVGRTINYIISDDSSTIGCIGFQNAMIPFPKPLDQWIGWRSQQQPKDYVGKDIKYILNNWRYTLMPNAPHNSGSAVLSLARNQVQLDWIKKYGNEIWLFYTLIGAGKSGGIYIADNWKNIGKTRGWHYVGGTSNKKYDTKFIDPTLQKLIFVRPTVKNWKSRLGVYRTNTPLSSQSSIPDVILPYPLHF